jgi:tetratricopeptide (TPR) repeat protein
MIVHDFGETETPQAKFDKNSHDSRLLLQQKLEKAKHLYQKSHAIKDYSDYGVMLIYNGQYTKAQNIFKEIEAKKPGLYATAANLGTVNELLGQDQQAYKWIKRAIEINPKSHHGSEWIHLKILDAKVHAHGNPDYYRTHDILGLNFGSDKIPSRKVSRDLYKVKEQLYDQLAERLTFIKPKDPIVAQLLFDAGNITAITDDVKTALEVYAQAREYGYSGLTIDKREKYFQQLQKKADETDANNPIADVVGSVIVLLIFATLCILGCWLLSKWKKRKINHQH